jgi:hypothetical protein
MIFNTLKHKFFSFFPKYYKKEQTIPQPNCYESFKASKLHISKKIQHFSVRMQDIKNES